MLLIEGPDAGKGVSRRLNESNIKVGQGEQKIYRTLLLAWLGRKIQNRSTEQSPPARSLMNFFSKYSTIS